MYKQKYDIEYHVQRLLSFHVKPTMDIKTVQKHSMITTLIILNYIKHLILKGNLFKFNIFFLFLIPDAL